MLIQKNSTDLYNSYLQQMHRIADLRYANAVLQWDQETYLPKKATDFRGQQSATLSELAHEFFTASTFGSLLEELSGRTDLDANQQRNIALGKYDFDKSVKLPAAFVRKMSEQVTKSYHAWVAARNQNSFAIFLPELEQLTGLKKQEADLLGYESHPYNALLNDYEKGSNVAWLDGVFGKLLQPLKALLDEVLVKQAKVTDPLNQFFDKDQQWAFCNDLLQRMGFDFGLGRQDLSEHPFTTSFSPQDVRITTRINEQNLGFMTWSTLHELGHAWYEQGLPTTQYGLPLGEACSLSIHESQSRLWENCIGRSHSFCEWLLPIIAEHFPKQMEGVTAEQLYHSVNEVKPSLIRTEADELTYHFHVMIRYEIEKKIMAGDLQVKEIPILWNELYSKYLGINVPDDKQGCLQDIHWSHGSFGYFPTYSLGSLYAVQLFYQLQKEKISKDESIAQGTFTPVINWLGKNVHTKGRQQESDALCSEICGEGLNSEIFIRYARSKFLP
jgi:carboxypeptidase Taq